MALTVWSAFDTFRGNVVDLTASETKTARSSRDYLFDQIKKLAASRGDFPQLYGSYLSYGSFARNVKLRPLDDVDVLVLLNGKHTQATAASNTPYTYWLRIIDQSCPLAPFKDQFGYVSSTKVLNAIKSGLSTIAAYGKADIKKNMQAVTLNLQSYPWVFDVVPAVPIGQQGTTLYYLIPNGYGDWIATNPTIDAANTTNTNKRHGGLFLPTARLLKYWNRRTHKPRLPSYYFETLAIKAFASALAIPNYPAGIQAFFASAATYLWLPCPDPKNLGPALDADITYETKKKVADALSEANTFAGYAAMYESQGKQSDAIYWWNRVFGNEFPTYG